MSLKKIFIPINLFLIPLIIILINNTYLVDFNTILNFSIFPITLGSIVFVLDIFFFKKNFFIKIITFLLLSNLFTNIFFFENNLVTIRTFLLLNLIIIIFFFSFNFFFKKEINLEVVNIFTIFLLCIYLYNFYTKNYNKEFNRNENIFLSANLNDKNLKNKPDIYHIIPDGLLNISEMKKYGYTKTDNLKKSLNDLNLEYYSKSFTNYPATYFSISSILNGSLIKENLLFYEKQIYETLYDSKLHNLLLKNGYEIFWYQTKWIGSKCNSKKYKCMNNSFYENELFENYLKLLNFNTNWINKILYKYTKKKPHLHLDKITSDLKKIHEIKKPRYIFGYLNLPHGPYTVDKDCTAVFVKNLNRNVAFNKDQYFEQVECFEKQIKNFIQKITNEYKKNNFIIIIQSDTGWAFDKNLIEEGRPHPNFPNRTWPKTYFENFLAISKNFECINKNDKISNSDLFPLIISCLNDEKIILKNNNSKFDVYYSNHPKHGKIYPRLDLN